MLTLTVERLSQVLGGSPIEELLRDAGVLVPIPGHTPRYASALWVAERIAHALIAQGIGADVQPLLVRTEVVPQSSSRRAASERVDPPEHYRTLSVQRPLAVPERITLVDDVVTRGSTLIAAATRVAEAFPGIEVRAFALSRVESSLDLEGVEEMLSPACEVVRYNEVSGILERRKS